MNINMEIKSGSYDFFLKQRSWKILECIYLYTTIRSEILKHKESHWSKRKLKITTHGTYEEQPKGCMLGSSFYDVYHIIFVWCDREKQRYAWFLYWSNFIKYMSTLVINKKYWVTHAVCTTYANTNGDAILHFL
jgi:hypothetical protein